MFRKSVLNLALTASVDKFRDIAKHRAPQNYKNKIIVKTKSENNFAKIGASMLKPIGV